MPDPRKNRNPHNTASVRRKSSSREPIKSTKRRTTASSSNKRRRRKKGLVYRIGYYISDKAIAIKDALGDGLNSNRRMALLALVGIFSVLVITLSSILVYRSLTSKNASEIFINGASSGMVLDTKITAQYVMEQVNAKLKADIGDINIKVNDIITVSQVRADKKDMVMFETLITDICKKLDYDKEAWAITVDGIEYAVLASKAECETVTQNILDSYLQENLDIISQSFVEEVQLVSKFVKPGETDTTDTAYQVLTKNHETEQSYFLKSGDNPTKVAAKFNMSLERLREINPDLPDDKNLKIGTEFKVIVLERVVQVKTIQVTKTIETELKKTEKKNNPNEPTTYTRIIQQGKNGQKEVITHITRINGIEMSSEVVDSIITVPPVDEIIEVGTK